MKNIEKIFSLFLFSHFRFINTPNIERVEIHMSKIDKNPVTGISHIKFDGKSNLTESVNARFFFIQYIKVERIGKLKLYT